MNGAGKRRSNSRREAQPDDFVRLFTFCYADLFLVRSAVTGRVRREILEQVPPVLCLEQLSPNLGGLIVWCAGVFQAADLIVARWDEELLARPCELQQGELISVWHAFRTKGVGCWIGADWRVGHIYRRAHGVTLQLLIDPRWVFPGHGWSQLQAGSVTLGGIFVADAIDLARKTIVGRPLVLGDPAYVMASIVMGQPGYAICRESVEPASR